jgi:hypothetical protein
VYNTEKEFKEDVAHTKNRLGLNHKNLLQLKDYSAGVRSDFCSTLYWLRQYFEYPNSDARFQASAMKKEGGFLSDSELTHMLYNIVDAGAHL